MSFKNHELATGERMTKTKLSCGEREVVAKDCMAHNDQIDGAVKSTRLCKISGPPLNSFRLTRSLWSVFVSSFRVMTHVVSVLLLSLTTLYHSVPCLAQTETATVSGLVTDQSSAVIPGAQVTIQSVERGTSQSSVTNNTGIYVFGSVQPGQYQIRVRKPGFKQVDFLGLIVNVQDHIEQNFRLQIGSVSESITVEATGLNVNTTDATVSTVIDRQFVDNMPLNGRSFQTLIELAPGVVATSSNTNDGGQFSVNGQRGYSNNFTVDGVSANAGITPFSVMGQAASGAQPVLTAGGGTNGLVPADALQEFKIETSSYAPEFGRTPGAQIALSTRSGTNSFHASAFDFVRNDAFDANDWFADAARLPKAAERQNDFGGVLGGTIVPDKLFFFGLYEGLRLRLPMTSNTTVPSLPARSQSSASIAPFINAFPLPTGPELLDTNGNPTGIAPLIVAFSNPSTLDSYGIRIDHPMGRALIFGRYSYARSDIGARSGSGGSFAPNSTTTLSIKTQSITAGLTWGDSGSLTNDFRFNYTRNDAQGSGTMDTFGGAETVPDSLLFPTPFSSDDSRYVLSISQGVGTSWGRGITGHNTQQQLDFVDGFSFHRGSHTLKFGAEFRRIFPQYRPFSYFLTVGFPSVSALLSGTPNAISVEANRGGNLLFQSFGLYAQDTWKIGSQNSLTFGVRWEFEPPTHTTGGASLLAINEVSDLANVALQASGTPLWKTTYRNFAPRVGLAHELVSSAGRLLVVRGGFGVFYDSASNQVGEQTTDGSYPFGAENFLFGSNLTFPVSATENQPPPIIPPAPGFGIVYASDPNLKLPYTLEWNASIEQELGGSQTLTVSYVGARGSRLLQQEAIFFPNPTFFYLQLAENTGFSNYNSLQMQFQRRLKAGVQGLLSYTFAHSTDNGSGSSNTGSNVLVRQIGPDINKGSSDFDIRHTLSGALSYSVPCPRSNVIAKYVLGGWSLDTLILARTAPPVEVFDSGLMLFNSSGDVRPDSVPGQPLYLSSPKYPGRRAINLEAFVAPPIDPTTGMAARQGDIGRNALRGFGATQWDLAVHRQFAIAERIKLEFRTEAFNVINHPNFASPLGDISAGPIFGVATRMLNRGLGQGFADSSFNPLYQIGGPRSLQFAMKLSF